MKNFVIFLMLPMVIMSRTVQVPSSNIIFNKTENIVNQKIRIFYGTTYKDYYICKKGEINVELKKSITRIQYQLKGRKKVDIKGINIKGGEVKILHYSNYYTFQNNGGKIMKAMYIYENKKLPKCEEKVASYIEEHKEPAIELHSIIRDGINKKGDIAPIIEGYVKKDKMETMTDDVHSGTLTAGEVNDLSEWKLWKNIGESEFKKFSQTWDIHIINRYCVLVTNENYIPLANVRCDLTQRDGKTIYSTLTDNAGRAELWSGLKDSSNTEKLYIKLTYREKTHQIKSVKPFNKGINRYKFSVECEKPNVLEIAFIVDATGSMGDEISYLKAEIKDVISRIKIETGVESIRAGTIFYRDKGDEYIVRSLPLTENIDSLAQFILKQKAQGGGDFPEAMDSALLAGLELGWSSESVCRIAFLIADAPPHQGKNPQTNIKNIIHRYSGKGIKILPVAASGVDRSCEFLMRGLAISTGSTYIYLSDHSGIGGKHITPITNKLNVELLNTLLIKVIKTYTWHPGCEWNQGMTDSLLQKDSADNYIQIIQDSSSNRDSILQLSVFPNPCNEYTHIHVDKSGGILYLMDISGKLLESRELKEQNKIKLNMEQYAGGIYIIQYRLGKRRINKKLIKN